MSVIPLDGDLAALQNAASELNSMDDTVILNMPGVFVKVMDLLYKVYIQHKESPYSDPNRQLVSVEQ